MTRLDQYQLVGKAQGHLAKTHPYVLHGIILLLLRDLADVTREASAP
jgi:hypothetical protein